MNRVLFSQDKIMEHQRKFMDYIGHDRNPHTAPEFHANLPRYLKMRWEKLEKINPELIEFTHHNYTGRNVWIPPRDPDRKFIVIFAHFDTVPNCPGFDDNGSGMTVMDFLIHWYNAHIKINPDSELNMAFLLNDFAESDPRIWPIFVGWYEKNDFSWADVTFSSNIHKRLEWSIHSKRSLPDRDSLIGIRKFVSMIEKQKLLGKIKFMINLETVGYTSDTQKPISGVPIFIDEGDFIAVLGNKPTQHWVDQFTSLQSDDLPDLRKIPMVVPGTGKEIPDSRNADHSVLWDMYIPTMFLTNTAYYRNPNYHSEKDTEVDYSFMAAITAHLIVFLQNT